MSGIYSELVNTSPMTYVINSPIANAVLKNSTEMNFQEQVDRLQEENRTLQRRLHVKSQENNKLQQRIEKVENELDTYKRLLTQINQSISNGQMSSNSQSINLALQSTVGTAGAKTKGGKSKAKKAAAHSGSNCACCCVAEKPFVCDWINCGKRFRQKPHLEAHRNIHTGRRFICDWPNCGKSFVRKYNLVEHQKLHSSVNPNMCTYPDCGKVFSSRYSLVRHQNAQHNLNL